MRALLLLGALLVFLAGIQLYVLAESTDRLFAWTIDVPLTAAFLGAFFWAAVPLALFNGLSRAWAGARVAVPGVWLFLVVALAATLMHASNFHFGSERFLARSAAWAWLVIYLLDPVLLLLAVVIQVRTPGFDPPSAAPLPGWYRAGAAFQAAAAVAAGVALFAAPEWAADLWPWALTPLTARAMAAWLLGLGVVLTTAWWENDWARIRPATIAYTVLGVLQLGALARFAGDVDWTTPAASAYVAVLIVVVLYGAYGWAASPRASESAPP
ncbi:MAG TPA: hypothetical protein VHL78_04050 [Actinomycetota bacterium]|nr:hypothetical protein [Actinomycetota bacterium]